MAAVVQLGTVHYEGQPPEVEDHVFESVQARRVRIAPQEERTT